MSLASPQAGLARLTHFPSLLTRNSAIGLAGTAMSFRRQPPQLRAARRPRRPPRLRQRRRLAHKLRQLVKAVLAIALLISKALRGKYEVAFDRDAAAIQRDQARFHVLRQTPTRRDGPTQYRFRRDLVHVLSAGAAGPGKTP